MNNIITKSLFCLYYVVIKALPPGTKRNRKNGIYEKQSNGKWIKVSEKKTDDINSKEKISLTELQIKDMVKKEVEVEEKKEQTLKQESKNFEKQLEEKYGGSWKATEEEKNKLKELNNSMHAQVKKRIQKEREAKKKIYIEKLKYKNSDNWEEKSDINNNEWYHGTFSVFDKFDQNKQGDQFGNVASKLGIHLTDSKTEASQYGDITKKIKVDLGKNLEISKDDVWDEYIEYLEKIYGDNEYAFEDQKNQSEFIDAIDYFTKKTKEDGFNSLTITDMDIWDQEGESTINTIIFDPKNTKVLETGIKY